MNKYYVYRHIRLDTLTPFNVGKGSGNRAFSLNNRNQYWHNISEKHGYKIEIIKHFDNEKDAFEFEKKMIKLYKTLGYCEANLTDGGEGSKGHRLSNLQKDKIRQRRLGSLHSRKCKIKMSKSHGGKPFKVWKCQKFENKYNKIEYLGTFLNQNECAKLLNINVGGIHMVLHGKRVQTNNYIFEYNK